MRRLVSARWLLTLVPITLAAGCAQSPMVLQGQLQNHQQQQLALSRRHEQLQRRADALDKDNQDLDALLAQSRQQAKVMEDQLAALRDQLSSVTSQLARTRDEKKESEKKVQMLSASLRRRGGVSITPNSSYQQSLPVINLPDVHVRRDGDVVRIELPSSQILDASGTHLSQGAVKLITDVAAELLRTYPDQIIGVEGHTDSDLTATAQGKNNHQLSIGWAMAVYNVLLDQGRFTPDQLFVAGHGANHPVVSNATFAGRQRNRRVELVVYPERKSR